MIDKKIEVSDKFFRIYRRFNVNILVEEVKTLPQRELYLLLTLCLDKFKSDDLVVKENLLPFKTELMILNDLFSDEKPNEQVIIDLVNDTDNQYISSNVLTYNNIALPDPYTTQEIRDLRISDLIN